MVQAAIVKKDADILVIQQQLAIRQQEVANLRVELAKLEDKYDAEVQDTGLASYMRAALTTDEVRENPHLYEEKINSIANMTSFVAAQAEATKKNEWEFFVERFPEAKNYKIPINFSRKHFYNQFKLVCIIQN